MSLANETLKTHKLSKIHQKIQSLQLNDSVLQKIVDKFNFAKNNSQSSQSSKTALPGNQSSCTAYAVQCNILCGCNECTSIGQNNSFSHEAFGVLSDQIQCKSSKYVASQKF